MNVSESVDKLRTKGGEHNAVSLAFLRADGGKVFPLDLLTIAVMNRSSALLSGFVLLIEAKNFIAAAPLVRFQLDSCLRLYASSLVDKPHDFALEVVKGRRVSSMKDRNNNRMTDAYLVEKMSTQYPELPWIKSVYEQTSGYVHLSEKHIYSAMPMKKGEPSTQIKIGAADAFVPEEDYVDAIKAFTAITGFLFQLVYSWAYIKNGRSHVDPSSTT